MKKWVYSMFLLLLLIVMCSCGSNTYVGTWYDASNPDGPALELYNDGRFLYRDVSGEYYVEGDTIILETTTAQYTSEVLTIGMYDGEKCLIEESGGDMYFSSYDFACSYKEKMTIAEEAQEENDFEKAKNNLENYLPGTWVAEKWGEGSKVVIHENGTYEDYLHGEIEKTGNWYVQKDEVLNDSLELVIVSSSGEEKDESVNINWFVNQASMEEYFIGKRGLNLGNAAIFHKVN